MCNRQALHYMAGIELHLCGTPIMKSTPPPKKKQLQLHLKRRSGEEPNLSSEAAAYSNAGGLRRVKCGWHLPPLPPFPQIKTKRCTTGSQEPLPRICMYKNKYCHPRAPCATPPRTNKAQPAAGRELWDLVCSDHPASSSSYSCPPPPPPPPPVCCSCATKQNT